MSSQTGSLRKAPLSAETLEKCIMTELNIVNFIIQTTYKYYDKYVEMMHFMKQIILQC